MSGLQPFRCRECGHVLEVLNTRKMTRVFHGGCPKKKGKNPSPMFPVEKP